MTAILFVMSGCLSQREMTTHPPEMLYAVPSYYYDTLKTIELRFLYNRVDPFLIYSWQAGNCFGPSVSASALILWTENGQSFGRFIRKAPRNREVRDSIFRCDSLPIFNYADQLRLDTITALPPDGIIMIPSVSARLEMMCNHHYVDRSFDLIGVLNSQDSLHPLCRFLAHLYCFVGEKKTGP